MFAAKVDHALRDVVIRTELARMLFHDGFLEFLDSTDRRIFGEVRLNCANTRLFHVFGSREIRFARTEVHDIDALLPQLDRCLHYRHGLRHRNARYTSRQFHCYFSFLNLCLSRVSTVSGTRPATEPPSSAISLTSRELR